MNQSVNTLLQQGDDAMVALAATIRSTEAAIIRLANELVPLRNQGDPRAAEVEAQLREQMRQRAEAWTALQRRVQARIGYLRTLTERAREE